MGARSSEVFEQAAVEPVVLTEASKPEFVIMSVQNYQQLLDRLTELEDRLLGQLAEDALQQSAMVGSEVFTAELEKLVEFEQQRS
jgi:PHD/YefM family antitoxin component YafN of YafNO toxin-antitoxin module